MCRNGYGCKRTNTKRRTPTSPTIHSHFDTTTYVRTYTSLTITNPLKNKPTYVRARVRVYVRKCVYVCTYVRMHACTYVCMYVCMHACMCMHTRKGHDCTGHENESRPSLASPVRLPCSTIARSGTYAGGRIEDAFPGVPAVEANELQTATGQNVKQIEASFCLLCL